MTLPASGPISFAQLQAEFGGPNYWLSTYYRGGGYVTRNNLAVPTSGPIALSEFRGAQKSAAGSASWASPGSYGIGIPVYDTITMEIWGAGGGGGGNSGSPFQPANNYFGGTGGQSYFAAPSGTIYANGGTGGGNCNPSSSGTPGSPGAGYYGDVTVTGGGNPGSTGNTWNSTVGGTGGTGGYVKKTWRADDPGAPAIGAAYTLVLGAGGAPGYGDWATAINGPGANASARLTWT